MIQGPYYCDKGFGRIARANGSESLRLDGLAAGVKLSCSEIIRGVFGRAAASIRVVSVGRKLLAGGHGQIGALSVGDPSQVASIRVVCVGRTLLAGGHGQLADSRATAPTSDESFTRNGAYRCISQIRCL
jgi:hypothetical protein